MVDLEKLKAGIRAAYPMLREDGVQTAAEKILRETDERLLENLRQWCEGEEISDIWVGDYCINAIMAIRGDRDFLDALDAMNLYLRDPDIGVRRIWRLRL